MVKVCLKLLMGICFFYGVNLLKSHIVHATTSAETINPQSHLDMTPFIVTTAIVGGSIALTLSYVSWRKYRAEVKLRNKNK